MSKLTNDCLTQSATGCFIAVPIRQQRTSNVKMPEPQYANKHLGTNLDLHAGVGEIGKALSHPVRPMHIPRDEKMAVRTVHCKSVCRAHSSQHC